MYTMKCIWHYCTNFGAQEILNLFPFEIKSEILTTVNTQDQ